jgi:hypothetical protein
VIVRFVDIGGIDNHDCLNLFFHNIKRKHSRAHLFGSLAFIFSIGYSICFDSVVNFLFNLLLNLFFFNYIYMVIPNNAYKPITNTAWVRARLCKSQKECTRLATASDKVYQLFAHGRWFSPGTPASSTTKTVLHDIAEILLKVALNIKNQINSYTW